MSAPTPTTPANINPQPRSPGEHARNWQRLATGLFPWMQQMLPSLQSNQLTILPIPLSSLINPAAALNRSGWTLSVPSNVGTATNMTDGSTTTSWVSSANIASGDTVTINLNGSVTVGAITVQTLKDGYTHFPLSGVIEGSNDNLTWTQLASWSFGIPQNNRAVANWEWTPGSYVYIRIRSTNITGSDGIAHPWGITELNLYAGTALYQDPTATGNYAGTYHTGTQTLTGAPAIGWNFHEPAMMPGTITMGMYIGIDAANCIGWILPAGGPLILESYSFGARTQLGSVTLTASGNVPFDVDFEIQNPPLLTASTTNQTFIILSAMNGNGVISRIQVQSTFDLTSGTLSPIFVCQSGNTFRNVSCITGGTHN